ncbi:MAG: hypothetical protein BMS9Abin05_0397 [Rhodothermia bacterium]|nr:MAG: hypothetical protein BMS9Abin05_0397 [Rhodothermia bacterium]
MFESPTPIISFSNRVVLRLSFLLSACLFVSIGHAQGRAEDHLPSRVDTLAISGNGPFLIRPFISPGSESVLLDSLVLSTDDYLINYRSGLLELLDRTPGESGLLVVSYEYIPISLTGSLRKWPLKRKGERPANDGRLTARRTTRDDRVYASSSQLRRSGSITRGITTGTGRDVAIESGLRLQVEGPIAEGLNLRAALTDEDTPILPEGSTQRLNEFDRVFIELQTTYGSVQLGDFDSRIGGGEYAQLRRKLQGVTAFGEIVPTTEGLFRGGSFSVAGATSRGIFRVQAIQPIDGIQGPYRLEGKNGERFIIVLPGSEVVYLDGNPLKRGELSDYVMDYATGELTFSPTRIVTSDRRISVEFQYSTEQFTRTLLAADFDTGFGRISNGNPLFSIGGSIVREADGDQFGKEFGLTPTDSLSLVLSGDTDAFSSGAIPVVYDPEALFTQYVIEKANDPANGDPNIFTVVTELPADSIQVFRVSFSRLGIGKGGYERAGLVSNGIAYRYVGAGKGEYEPVRPLPKPALKQVFDVRATFNPAPILSFSGEWASSINDLNRLSSIDAADDEGRAYHYGVTVNPTPIRLGDRSLGLFSAAYTRRSRDVEFSTFERIRPIEFARKWNIQNVSVDATGGIAEAGDEQSDRLSTRFAWSDSSFIDAGYGRLSIGSSFEGSRWDGRIQLSDARYPRFKYQIESISSENFQFLESGNWFRQQGRVSKGFLNNSFVPFVELEHENLEQRSVEADSLVAPSIRFLETRVGATWNQTTYAIRTEIERRAADHIISGAWRSFNAWTVSSTLSVDPSRALHSDVQVGVRRSDSTPLPAGLNQDQSKNSFVLRWNGRWRGQKKGINLTWLYQAQTELSATMQEIYIRTGQERGEYVWLDENEDGAIQLEEFIPETTPDEGLYVRTFIPSDSLESTTGVRGRIRLDLSPGSLFATSSHGLQTFLKGVSSSTVIDVEEKSRTPDRNDVYFLRIGSFRSSEYTLNGRFLIRQDFSFFRNSRVVDLNLNLQTARSLSELSAGEERRESDLLRVSGRFTFHPKWTVRAAIERSFDVQNSESFASRNFDIVTTGISPSVTWNASQPILLTLAAVISQKDEQNLGGTATTVRIPIDARYRLERKFDLAARFEVASVDLSGQYAGRTAFELTDGRGAGTSYLWRLTLQSNLSDVLTATVSYDGRAPKNRDVIHTARFELSARF